MKKLFIMLCTLGLLASPALATTYNSRCDYSAFCAPKAYDISSKGGQITSKVTGMTLLSEKLAQLIIKKQLKKATKENFKVEIKSYSAKDLLNGRFSSLKISGKDLKIDDAYISSFKAVTACDFNYIQLDKKTLKFKENMVLNYSLEISNNDLQKTIKSAGYMDMINKVKLSGLGITFFKLDNANVQIKNNKLYFTVNFTTPMSTKPVPVVIRTDLKVEDGDIVLTKIDFVNLYTVIDLSKITYLLNMINPLTFSTEILNNKDTKMKIQTVEIKNDRIFIKGNVFIPKNCELK